MPELLTPKKHLPTCIISLVLGAFIVFSGFDSVQGGSIPNVGQGNMFPLPTSESQTPDALRICTTKICKETALVIQNAMNLNVNPCDDFYDFACSKYKPQIEGAVSPFHEVILKYNNITQEMTNRLKDLPRLNDHWIIRYAQDVYNNCLTARNQIDNPTDVRNFIRKTLNISYWPIRELPGLGTNYLNDKIAEFKLQFSLSTFFVVELILDPSIVDKVIFDIKEPTFNLPIELRSSENLNSSDNRSILNSYSVYVYKLMREFGGQLVDNEEFEDFGENDFSPRRFEKLNAREMSKKVVQFEQALFDITNAHTNKSAYEEFTLSELDRVLSQTETLGQTRIHHTAAVLSLSLRRTLKHIIQKTGNSTLQDHDKIKIFNSTVFRDIVSLISSTKKEIVVNYLGYRLAHHLVPLSPLLNKLYLDRGYTITPGFIPAGITTECMAFAKEIFLRALTRYPEQMTVKQESMFNENVEGNLREMYLNMKSELIRRLPNNNQLTGNRRISALEDIQNVRFCPDNWFLNKTTLEEYYAEIPPLNNSYLEHYSLLKSWNMTKYFRTYGKPSLEIDTCDMEGPSPTYYQDWRQINLPPVVWIEPSYNKEWPSYLKYSEIGNAIGHEWMHALFHLVAEWVDNPLTDNLKKYSSRKISRCVKDGFLDARSRNSRLQLINIVEGKTFQSSQCIVDQYDEFSPSSIAKRDGIRTFQENFADIGGMELAYSVYKSGQSGAVEETLLGLEDYSNDQLFFLNFARGWCETYKESAIYWNRIDTHSPSKYRVLGTLRNSEEFSRAWNCPVGSYMNPVDKCPIF